jgi:thiol-disulfide isomerase/thioredoxin
MAPTDTATRASCLPLAVRRRRADARRSLLLGAAALLVAAGCGAAQPAPSAPSPLLGRPLPELRRPALDGTPVDARANAGSVVVVEFFADYCEPCKRTLPVAQRLHEEYPDVVVVGVAEDELRSTAEALVARFGITFPVVHDSANVIAGRFRVTEMPIAFVADASGVIRWVAGERHAEGDLERAVLALR